MAHARTCAKENGLMRIYVRARESIYESIFAPVVEQTCHLEVTDVASSRSHREGSGRRDARQSARGRKIERHKTRERY
jgi:hypothetical protein